MNIRAYIRPFVIGFTAWMALALGALAEDGARTNRLIDSNNPYLLLHARNPVDWYPWGPEAFAKAKAENKPIFLSVGYSTCYWCHVADRTLYSDPEIAALMNKWFVNVKVDSEQRSDVDRIYMLARNILSDTAGWPNNLFLTPELKPFFAWGYLTPEDDPSGAAGFVTILRQVNLAWADRQDRLVALAEIIYLAMEEAQSKLAQSSPQALTPAAWLARARRNWLDSFDELHGGISIDGTNKFPLATNLAMLIADYRLSKDPDVRHALTRTLDAMALGGIYDQIGGGFHRYSVDRSWSVPHFEKMLYDNVQLMAIYADAYQLTGQGLYRAIAIETGDFVLDYLTVANGGYYTALDAQIDGVEGVSYVWSANEVFQILGTDEAQRLFRLYDLSPIPEALGREAASLAETGVPRVHLPQVDDPVGAAINGLMAERARFGDARRRLKAARDRRPQPMRDDKLLVALNGLAIDAFARTAALLERPDYLTAAQQAAENVWRLAYAPDRRLLAHEIFNQHAQGDGFLVDYALFGAGLMTLAETTGAAVWRHRAATLADIILARFMTQNGRLTTAEHTDDLLFPVEDIGDDIHPSGTSAAIDLFLRLAPHPDHARFGAAARRIARLMGGQVAGRPEAWGSLLTALTRADVADEVAAAVQADQAGSPSAESFHVPSTADHVSVSATRGQTGAGSMIVTVTIDPGFHINANPASLDFLIPTQVQFDGLTPKRIDYPAPVIFAPDFVDQPLAVYENIVPIAVEVDLDVLAADLPLDGTVTAQACDAKLCLPPADLPFTIE